MADTSKSYVRCRHCHRHYFRHTEALRCPHCGHRIRWATKYLKLWVIVIVVAVLLILALVELVNSG